VITPAAVVLAGLLSLALGGTTSAQPSTLEYPAPAAPAAQSAPTVSAIDPASAANDIETDVTITGTGLTATPTASLGATALTHVTRVSSTTLTATVPWGLNPGVYTLTVVNPDGGTASRTNAFTVTQGIGQWNGGNLFGGQVTQILMKPGDPNTLYALAYDVGLFRSKDAGEHWSFIWGNVIANIDFVVDPLHPQWLYCYAWDGLYRSRDEGDTWTKLMNTWPDGRSVSRGAVFVSPHDAQVLFVGSSNPGGGSAGGALGMIESTDGGTTWGIVADMEGLSVQDVAFHPTDPLKMVLTTSDGRVFGSGDGGGTWSEVAKPPLSTLGILGGTITYNPSRPAEVWLASGVTSGTTGGIYKSTDAAMTGWQDVTPTDGNYNWSFIRFTGADSVYTTQHHSVDGGSHWDKFGPFTSYGETSFDPGNPQIGYIGDDTYGVEKTIDGGKTWDVKNQGLAGMICDSISVSRADPLRVYATFGDWPGIYSSNDGASSWTYLPITGSIHVGVVREDPSDPKRLYVASHSNFYVSADEGKSWSDLGWNATPSWSTGMIAQLATDSHQPGHLLAGMVSVNGHGAGPGRLYSSSDYGASWQQVTMPQDLAWITEIAFDPNTPGLVYLTTNGTGVYRMTYSKQGCRAPTASPSRPNLSPCLSLRRRVPTAPLMAARPGRTRSPHPLVTGATCLSTDRPPDYMREPSSGCTPRAMRGVPGLGRQVLSAD
jgi:photosystem II stability/assembly factor-like uncharacterized protein